MNGEMGIRRGFTAYQRAGAGPWTVEWKDGEGKKRAERGIHTKREAGIIGRYQASQADLVRCGVADPRAFKIAGAIREPIEKHADAWQTFLKDKGNTPGHVSQSRSRIDRLFRLGGVTRLSELDSDKIQRALAKISSPQNARHFLTALKAFMKWCLESDRLLLDPIRAVKPPNVAGETFTRRPFTPEELEAIFHAAETRDCKSTTVCGADRSMYYRVQAYTGLRVSEAKSLTRESFNLETGFVTVEAAYSKHRRKDSQPLRADLIAKLRPWLDTKTAGRVFEFGKHANLHRIFKADCKAAGIEAKAAERVGMHSLRRFYITHVVGAGNLATGQRLARHSDPKLTAKYVDLNAADYEKALAGLPSLAARS
jgi:integrase